MIKVILVDDEYLELDLLLDNVDWQHHGFEVCATARNGKEAMEKIALFKPDVVITDIKMPIIDGVELSNKIKELYSEIEIVFLSGYDQFEYLKNAIKINAIDYILKPIIVSEVPDLLEKIKARIKNKKTLIYKEKMDSLRENLQLAYRKHLYSLPEDNTNNNSSSIESVYYILFFIDEVNYLVSKFGESALDERELLITKYIEQNDGVAVKLNNATYMGVSNSAFSHELSGSFITASSYNQHADIRDLLLSIYDYEKKYKVLSKTHYPGYIIDKEKNESTQISDRPSFNELLPLIRKKQTAQIDRWMTDYYHSQNSDTSSYLELPINLIDYLFSNIPELENSSVSASKAIYLKTLSSITSTPLLVQESENIINDIIEYSESLTDNLQNKVVSNIKAYIDNNYFLPLSVDSIAAYFNYSSSYISAIFKKHFNTTIMNYLTDYRLSQSAALLKQSNLKINQVANKVGYPNSSYYCAVFSKKYGMTPKQYRMKAYDEKH